MGRLSGSGELEMSVTVSDGRYLGWRLFLMVRSVGKGRYGDSVAS